MIRILIADAHCVVRRGLRHLVAGEPDLEVGGEVDTATDLLRRLRVPCWEVLILGLNLPDGTGLEGLRQVKESWPRLPVLVFGTLPEEEIGVRALAAGAAGYLPQDITPSELVEAIRRVHGGGKFIRPSLAERLAATLHNGHGRPAHEYLSDREYEVLRRLAKGQTVTEVARELGLNVKTASTYRSRLLEKMGLRSNVDLVRYALRHGLVD